MERMAWTDERLDDRFDHIDSELTELRQDMRDMRSALRGEIDRLRLAMITVGGSGFLGLIAAILVTG